MYYYDLKTLITFILSVFAILLILTILYIIYQIKKRGVFNRRFGNTEIELRVFQINSQEVYSETTTLL